MTGSEFYNYVIRLFKRTDKETEVYEAITDVVMDIKLSYGFEDFKTEDLTLSIAAAGDYTIDLSSYDIGHLLGEVRLLDDAGGSKALTKLSKSRYDQLYPYPSETDADTGVPKHFCVYGNTLYLAPVPDSTSYKYGISFTTEEETAITSGTSNVPFTDRYRWVLRYLVLAEMYYGMGNDDEGNKWQSKGLAGINKMVMNDEFNVTAPDVVQYTDV